MADAMVAKKRNAQPDKNSRRHYGHNLLRTSSPRLWRRSSWGKRRKPYQGLECTWFPMFSTVVDFLMAYDAPTRPTIRMCANCGYEMRFHDDQGRNTVLGLREPCEDAAQFKKWEKQKRK